MKSTILNYLNNVAQNISNTLGSIEKPMEYVIARTRIDLLTELIRELSANLPDDPKPEAPGEKKEE